MGERAREMIEHSFGLEVGSWNAGARGGGDWKFGNQINSIGEGRQRCRCGERAE